MKRVLLRHFVTPLPDILRGARLVNATVKRATVGTLRSTKRGDYQVLEVDVEASFEGLDEQKG